LKHLLLWEMQESSKSKIQSLEPETSSRDL
jgi:hypothetical protein